MPTTERPHLAHRVRRTYVECVARPRDFARIFRLVAFNLASWSVTGVLIWALYSNPLHRVPREPLPWWLHLLPTIGCLVSLAFLGALALRPKGRVVFDGPGGVLTLERVWVHHGLRLPRRPRSRTVKLAEVRRSEYSREYRELPATLTVYTDDNLCFRVTEHWDGFESLCAAMANLDRDERRFTDGAMLMTVGFAVLVIVISVASALHAAQ